MTRKEMIDNMIRKYGFESTVVLIFAKICEEYENNSWNDDIIRIFYENNMQEEISE